MHEILVFLVGFVVGIITALCGRWWYDRSNKNRLGTDSNIIQQSVGKVTEATSTIKQGTDELRKHAEELADSSRTASSIGDDAKELAGIVRKYKE